MYTDVTPVLDRLQLLLFFVIVSLRIIRPVSKPSHLWLQLYWHGMICSSTSRTDNSMQAAHAEFKGYTYNRQCACKRMPVLRRPNVCDDTMRFNTCMNSQAMALQVSCKVASAEFQQTLGLHCVQLAVFQNYKRAHWEIFFSAMSTKGSSSSHFMVLASVMK